MENYKILLNKNRSKKSINVNNSLTARLKSSKKLIPIDPISATISEISIYNKERENCSDIRLTVEVNPICSNVLFNNITEIVKDEGTDQVRCLNYDRDKGKYTDEDFSNLMYKDSNVFNDNDDRIANAIRDTQLSNNVNNFHYHCGIDIFNNHLLRSKTFKTICPLKNEIDKSNDFNTIKDTMRSYDGKDIWGYSDTSRMYSNRQINGKNRKEGEPDIKLHVYLNEDILSYKDSVENNLIEENGWFGFTNRGKLKIYPNENTDKDYDWFKVINSKKPCDFIDLYPERDLFYFDPKYNKYKRRIEKNWHYCITYPSSSTTNGISFFDNFDGRTTLKIMYFDDNQTSSNGVDGIKIYSISKHGLSKGNYINLYTKLADGSHKLLMSNAEVIHIEDDYTFYVFRNGVKISNKWVDLKRYEDEKTRKLPDKITVITGKTPTETAIFENENRKYLKSENGKKYYIINNDKVNIDDNTQSLSFAKVIGNNEVKYYVRIFSKLPNWKYSKYKVDEEFLEKMPNYMLEYQGIKNEFENHVGKLAFSKNIYNDNIGEIVFTDNINFNYLKDNLGRPLTELYLTIIKNNEGYREWYGKRKDIDITANNIEYSHCFGKLSCGFKLSKDSIINDDYSDNVILINNIDNRRNGLSMNNLNGDRIPIIDEDEIQYNEYDTYSGDTKFYGDLCYYSDALCNEMIIQDINFRFNTAQRELKQGDFPVSNDIFSKIKYDEIISDDFDEGFDTNDNGVFEVEEDEFNLAGIRKEGYYYKAHYKIPIKSFSSKLTTEYPRFIKMKSFTPITIEGSTGNDYEIISMGNHCLGDNEYIYAYDKKNDKLYNCLISIPKDKTNPRLFNMTIEADGSQVNLNKENFTLFKKQIIIPSYASFINDGSCRYMWRDIIQNGFDNDSDNEIYPFTNNALYINKRINLYLRRQNPSLETDLKCATYPYDISSNNNQFDVENKYYNEEDIEC